METRLLNCPFCGGEGQLIVDLVQCARCAAVGPFTKRELHGIAQPGESWNARTPSGISEEEREALELAIGYLSTAGDVKAFPAQAVLRALLRRASVGA